MPDESFDAIVINTQRDFLKHMPEIIRRLNASPEIAKLALINPIFALDDLGVTLAPGMSEHVQRTFHSPPAKQRRLAELEEEIRSELDKLPGQPGVPTTPEERANIVFRALGVQRFAGDADDLLDHERLRAYSHRHPLIPKLIEHDSVSRSRFVFFPRAIYDAYKQGTLRNKWVNSVRFGAPAPNEPTGTPVMVTLSLVHTRDFVEGLISRRFVNHSPATERPHVPDLLFQIYHRAADRDP